MQAALDSTALMLSKDLSQGLITPSEVNAKAKAYFAALYTNTYAQSVAITAIYTASSSMGSTIQIDGSAAATTGLMKVIGFPNINFNASSTAAWEIWPVSAVATKYRICFSESGMDLSSDF